MDAQLTKTGVVTAYDKPRGLLNLPGELLLWIFSYLLVSSLPFVDPLPPKKLLRQRSSDGKLLMSEMMIQAGALHHITKAVKENSLAFHTQIEQALRATAGDAHTVKRQSIFLDVLYANKHCHQQGTKVLCGRNILMFSTPMALECFAEYYSETAKKAEKVVMLLMLYHGSTELRGFSNPELPGRVPRAPFPHCRCIVTHCYETQYLNECPSNPVFIKYDGITNPRGLLSGAFAALRCLTLHVVDESQLNSAVLVREVRGADLTNWARAIAGGGWKVPMPRITGLESVEDQTVVEEAVELLRAD